MTTIDAAGLREKYRSERNKRLRSEGNEQYLQPFGRFANLLEDPYVEARHRDPITRDVNVAIIGGGFAGLTTAAALVDAGVKDIVLIESGGDVGGAWYWNRYPGAMCDTAAMVYLPLLEETGHMPTAKYVKAPEIFAHARRIASHYGLYENAMFSTSVTKLEWNETQNQWTIYTFQGDVISAKFVSMGTGPLNRPKLPGIAGIDSFDGPCFHTSRWDYAITGGDPTCDTGVAGSRLRKLAHKRVGIIGTGATGVQAIPVLSRDCGELYVFQRTPSSIDVRNNVPINEASYPGLEKGWQKEWLTNFATLQSGGFADVDLVKDGWTDIASRIRDRVAAKVEAGAEFSQELRREAYEESDDEKMCEIRARVDAVVKDPTTQEGLKAWYRQLCKRPCFHDEYLDAYNNPNTHLVDTDGKGVERIDATGLWVAGVHYELDVLIFASGFEVGTPFSQRSGFETYGRDGVSLSDAWGDGMVSLHGMFVNGFPNLFIVGPSQGANFIANVTQNLTHAGVTIGKVVLRATAGQSSTVEVSKSAQSAWVEHLKGNVSSFLGDPNCTPGYYNNEGKPTDGRDFLNGSGYPEGPVAFWEYVERWGNDGRFEGLEFC